MIDIVELNSFLRTFLFLEIIHMPKKSSSNGPRIKVTEDDVLLLEGGEEQDDSAGPDDLDSVGVDNDVTKGTSNGSSLLGALHSSLTTNVKRTLEVDETQFILSELHRIKLSLAGATKLLRLLKNIGNLSDDEMDDLGKIAGFAVNSDALALYIKEIGGSRMTDRQRSLVQEVTNRSIKRAILPVMLDSQDHEAFAGTIAPSN